MGGTALPALPTPDATGTTAMSATAGKVTFKGIRATKGAKEIVEALGGVFAE